MNQKQIRAAVEAMLFASGDPIGADKLAQAVQLPQLSVEAALEALRERYAREDSGLCLLHLNTHWQLATKADFAEPVRRVLDTRRSVPLGPAAMETLTVIAYNQPVSRAFIEQVRAQAEVWSAPRLGLRFPVLPQPAFPKFCLPISPKQRDLPSYSPLALICPASALWLQRQEKPTP